MSAGPNEVYFGPYKLPQKCVTALEAYGIQDPDDIANFTMTDIRAIPGFGPVGCQAVRKYRDFESFQSGKHGGGIDLEMPEPVPEPEPPKQINICLTVSKSGPFRLRHYEWCQNVIANLHDASMGASLENESDLMAFIIRKMYAADPTKGGTVGVPTGGATRDAAGNPVANATFIPQLNA